MRISDWSSDVCSSDLESQLQAASVIGATSPYCGGNVQVPGCNWSSIEDGAMKSLKQNAFRLPDFLLSDDVLAKASLSRQEAFDLTAQAYPTLLSILLESHRVKELARRSLEDRKSTRLNSSH